MKLKEILDLLKTDQLNSMKDILENCVEISCKIYPNTLYPYIKEEIIIKCKILHSHEDESIMIVLEDITKFEKSYKLESIEAFQ